MKINTKACIKTLDGKDIKDGEKNFTVGRALSEILINSKTAGKMKAYALALSVFKDEEVKEKMNQQIDYMVEQLKSMDNVVKYFKKNSEDEFKTELFEILKQQKLAAEMQKKIIDPIQITPEETRNFFKKIFR